MSKVALQAPNSLCRRWFNLPHAGVVLVFAALTVVLVHRHREDQTSIQQLDRQMKQRISNAVSRGLQPNSVTEMEGIHDLIRSYNEKQYSTDEIWRSRLMQPKARVGRFANR